MTRGGLGRLAASLKPGGPVWPWAGLIKMTISETCNAFFIDVNSFYHCQFHHRHRFQSVVAWSLPLAAWLSHLSVVTDWQPLCCRPTGTEAVKRPSLTPFAGSEREAIRHTERGAGLNCLAPVVDYQLSLECSGSNLISLKLQSVEHCVVGVGQGRCAFRPAKIAVLFQE